MFFPKSRFDLRRCSHPLPLPATASPATTGSAGGPQPSRTPRWDPRGPTNGLIYSVLIVLLIPMEENELRKACGEQYGAYQQKTQKLIPFVS